jgi:hypothetical protein
MRIKKFLPFIIIGVIVVAALASIVVIKSWFSKPVTVQPDALQIIPTREVSEGTKPEQTTEKTITPGKNQFTLTVSAPTDGSTVTTSSIVVKGLTAPNAEVFINDAETKANSIGNFSSTIVLEEGDNYISVVAVDVDGNSAEQELTVMYESQK